MTMFKILTLAGVAVIGSALLSPTLGAAAERSGEKQVKAKPRLAAVSPGCDAPLTERLDWATEWDARHATNDPSLTPTEMLLPLYKKLRLCAGEEIHQSGQVIKGPKASGVPAPASFRPTGTVIGKGAKAGGNKAKKGGASARMISCSEIAFDPQFPGNDTVRAGGRSICNQTTTLYGRICINSTVNWAACVREV